MESHPILNLEHLRKYGIVDFSFSNENIPRTRENYNEWVEKKKHKPLNYLEGKRKDVRQDVKNYFPNFSQSITFLFSYSSFWQRLRHFYKTNHLWNGQKIASYVLGFKGYDYHHLVRNYLEEISKDLKQIDPKLEIKLSLDIHPVLERDMAVRSGLGWFGKNSMFIHKQEGSFLILGSLLLSKKVFLGLPLKIETDHCGQCTRCIDACPTDAIEKDSRTLISSLCISTFTIEMFKDVKAPKNMEKGAGEIFGCDICQDVCPFNQRLLRVNPIANANDIEMLEEGENKKLIDFFLKRPLQEIIDSLEKISNRKYQKDFFFSALARTGRIGMLKNLKFYKRP